MFKGVNVNLRAIEKEDIPILNSLRNDEEVLTYLPSRLPLPVSQRAAELEYDEKSKRKHRTDAELLIETKDGTVIGKCGTMETKWKNGETTVYIFTGGDEYRGKGYGTEAMRILVSYAFEQMNMNRVRLFVFAFNERAIKSYEKTGFVVEGRLRQELYRNGRYYDVIQMSILKREYEVLKKGWWNDAV